jgi:hypothetical protein
VSERKRKEEAVERKENRSSLFFFSFYPRVWRIRVGQVSAQKKKKKKNLEIRPNPYRLEEIQPVFTKKKKKPKSSRLGHGRAGWADWVGFCPPLTLGLVDVCFCLFVRTYTETTEHTLLSFSANVH